MEDISEAEEIKESISTSIALVKRILETLNVSTTDKQGESDLYPDKHTQPQTGAESESTPHIEQCTSLVMYPLTPHDPE